MVVAGAVVERDEGSARGPDVANYGGRSVKRRPRMESVVRYRPDLKINRPWLTIFSSLTVSSRRPIVFFFPPALIPRRYRVVSHVPGGISRFSGDRGSNAGKRRVATISAVRVGSPSPYNIRRHVHARNVAPA